MLRGIGCFGNQPWAISEHVHTASTRRIAHDSCTCNWTPASASAACGEGVCVRERERERERERACDCRGKRGVTASKSLLSSWLRGRTGEEDCQVTHVMSISQAMRCVHVYVAVPCTRFPLQIDKHLDQDQSSSDERFAAPA